MRSKHRNPTCFHRASSQAIAGQSLNMLSGEVEVVHLACRCVVSGLMGSSLSEGSSFHSNLHEASRKIEDSECMLGSKIFFAAGRSEAKEPSQGQAGHRPIGIGIGFGCGISSFALLPDSWSHIYEYLTSQSQLLERALKFIVRGLDSPPSRTEIPHRTLL